ncbi:MAG: hypothetical protein ACE5LS_02990 [Thermoplasmata archaeon]
MPPGLRFLLAPFLVSVSLLAAVPSTASGQAYPTFSPGDFWEYAVEARLDALLGVGNVSGALVAEGETRVEVTAVEGTEATLTWDGDLDLQGRLILPGENTEAAVSGTIKTTYEERRQEPHFLPLAFSARSAFEVTVTFVVTIPYTATLEVNATISPSASSPTYPLELEDRIFVTDATLVTNVTVDFLGLEIQNSTVDQVASTIQWNVTSSPSVEVPAGTFSGLRVQMEATTGFVPSPFQALIPGVVQVTHHSPTVGSPVLFEFFANGTEVGNASLRTYSYASSTPLPFWQNPIFLGSLLAIPIGVLLYRYWRERRRGL